MAETNVIRISEAPPGIRATIDASLNIRGTLDRALGELGTERKMRVAAEIDAFSAKPGALPADAVKAQVKLEALQKGFDEQEAALVFWTKEVHRRLDSLALDFPADVLAALDIHIAALKQKESKEQDDVDEVASRIREFDALRIHLQSYQQPKTGSHTKHGSEKKGV